MASTYSTNLAIELIGTGEQSGTWGTTTNTNLGTLIEQSISGYVTQAITDGSGANTTITIPNGATGVARNMFIEMTGALTFSTTSLIVPANKKMYFIFNNTTGGFAVTVKVSGQTGVLVPNGKKVILTSNGTDIVEAANQVVGAFGVGGTATMAAINASGLVAMAGAATVGTTLTVSGTASIGTSSVTNDVLLKLVKASGLTGANQFGIDNEPTFSSAATAGGYATYISASTQAAAFTMTNLYNQYIATPTIGAGSSVTNMYGLYIANILGAGTSNYAIYTNTGQVHFGGAVDTTSTLSVAGTSTMAAINASGSVTLSGTSFFRSITTSNVPGTFNFYLAASGIREGTAGDFNIDTYNGGWGSRMTISQAGAVTIPGTLGVTGRVTVGNNTGAANLDLSRNTSAAEAAFRIKTGGSDVWAFGSGLVGTTAFEIYDYGAAAIVLSIAPTTKAVTIPGTLGMNGAAANGVFALLGRSGLASMYVQRSNTAQSFGVDDDGNVYAGQIGASTGTALILSGGYIKTLTSSRRYKKDEEPIDIGLDFINTLKPIKFRLKENDLPQVGFIAEDFPDERLVDMSYIDIENKELGMRPESVHYSQITAPLVKAVQELSAKVAALEAAR